MQQLQQIEALPTLPQLKPLISSDKRACLKYPSSVDLLVLSVDICYKAHLILTKQSKIKKNVIIEDYIKQSTVLLKILNDYESIDLDMRDYRKIQNNLGLKGI